MDAEQSETYIARFKQLSVHQQAQAIKILNEAYSEAQSVLAVEQRVRKDLRCPHFGTEGAYKHGITRGLQRYRCAKGCGRTFNAVSDSPLSGLHHKEKWLAFAAAQMRLETVRESARSCGIAVSTAFRWRHRFLSTQTPNDKLQGVVEVDETLFLHSRKGDRKVKD